MQDTHHLNLVGGSLATAPTLGLAPPGYEIPPLRGWLKPLQDPTPVKRARTVTRMPGVLNHADSGRIKPGSEMVNNPDPDSFRPQNQTSRTQNPQQTRPQPPVERGWADKADSRPPLRGPGGWGGDWYVWHAPDGLRARAATGLECMQADAEKLGVIEASYASAIIGVLSPVSSHC